MINWPDLAPVRDIFANTWLLLGLWIFGALLWFIPAERLGDEAIVDTLNAYRGWIGLTTLGFFCVWAALTAKTIVKWAQDRRWFKNEERARHARDEEARQRQERERDQRKRAVLAHLEALNSDEAGAVALCLASGERTIAMNLYASPGPSLVQKELFEAAKHGDASSWQFTMVDFVWDHLQQNVGRLPEKIQAKYNYLTASDHQ